MAIIVFFRKIFSNLIRLPLFLVYQVHDRFCITKKSGIKILIVGVYISLPVSLVPENIFDGLYCVQAV